MRRYDIVSRILLILSIVDFALAAPVLVQETRQAGVDVGHIPEDAIPMLGKRGDGLTRDELWLKFLSKFENHFAIPDAPIHGWTDVNQPLPSIPEHPSPVSSPKSLTESGHGLAEEEYAPPRAGPSRPASSTMSDADRELVGAHAPPSPGPSTEFDQESMEAHAPLSSPVFPTWFHPDHGSMGAHAPQPNSGPSNPWSSTEFDSDHRFVVEEPPSRPASPTESDHDMADVPPSSPVH